MPRLLTFRELAELHLSLVTLQAHFVVGVDDDIGHAGPLFQCDPIASSEPV